LNVSRWPLLSRLLLLLLLLKHAYGKEQLHTCKLMYLLMPDISAVDCSMFSKELDGGSSTSNSGGRKQVCWFCYGEKLHGHWHCSF